MAFRILTDGLIHTHPNLQNIVIVPVQLEHHGRPALQGGAQSRGLSKVSPTALLQSIGTDTSDTLTSLCRNESLKLTIERTLPYWNNVIVPQIKVGN